MNTSDYSLDHVLIAVRDLECAARTYSDGLGFSLSPEGVHPGRGTHNRLITFASEYLELIAYRDRSEGDFRPTMAAFLRRREGLYMFAIGTDDLDRAVSDMRGRGIAVEDPVAGARQASGGRPGYTWRSAALPADATPGSETFLIQHDMTMRERYGETRSHRNGAAGLHSLQVAVTDAEDAASRWADLLGLEPGPAVDETDVGGRSVSLGLRNCRLEFVSPAGPGAVDSFLKANGGAPYRLVLDSAGRTPDVLPQRAHGVPLAFA